MEILSKNVAETNKEAGKLANKLVPLGSKATVIGLYGNLGSGKTTFVQGLARALGISEIVTSPTFVIEKIYKLPTDSQFDHLIHIDCYRLEKESELEVLGFNNILNNPRNLIVIEWPEKVKEIMPADHRQIHFEFVDGQTRQINILEL